MKYKRLKCPHINKTVVCIGTCENCDIFKQLGDYEKMMKEIREKGEK